MTIEALYTNSDFLDYVVSLSLKKRIDDKDDYIQDVFLELAECGESWSIKDAMKVADKIGARIKRNQIKYKSYSLISNTDSPLDNDSSPLWEDNHYL